MQSVRLSDWESGCRGKSLFLWLCSMFSTSRLWNESILHSWYGQEAPAPRCTVMSPPHKHCSVPVSKFTASQEKNRREGRQRGQKTWTALFPEMCCVSRRPSRLWLWTEVCKSSEAAIFRRRRSGLFRLLLLFADVGHLCKHRQPAGRIKQQLVYYRSCRLNEAVKSRRRIKVLQQVAGN